MNTGAAFSYCGRYRYDLWRIWDAGKPFALFLMLNPSTADHEANDPTVERCQRRALAMGYGGLHVCNLFAFRATNPLVMIDADDPVGPLNDGAIVGVAEEAGIVICGWGIHGKLHGRSGYVRELLRLCGIRAHCLRMTQSGEPGHPLYIPYDAMPVPMEDHA